MIACLVLCMLAADPDVAAPAFPGDRDEWNGYARYTFQVDGRSCFVVAPRSEAEGRPWIWRARFFGHRPEVDLALLARGWHLVYMDVADMFGNPEAVAHWDAFYAWLTEQHKFAPKAALEGMSRGGLIVYNWAARNPEKVSCIYADAPVCDIRSWPGGKGKGEGSPEAWATCLLAYRLTEAGAAAFRGNPLDHLEPLAQAGVPLLHVSGDADPTVPIEENTLELESRYKALGGGITVIVKPGVDHTHGLDDPTPIVEFILKHTRPAAAPLMPQS